MDQITAGTAQTLQINLTSMVMLGTGAHARAGDAPAQRVWFGSSPGPLEHKEQEKKYASRIASIHPQTATWEKDK